MIEVDIVKALMSGVFTPSLLADELNISKSTLNERLFRMEQMGFIEKEKAISPCGSSKCCCGCSGSCSSNACYLLTEKGKRLLKC